MKTRENFYSGYKDQHAMDDATLKLIEENADHLIDYLYDSRNQNSLFGNPEIRIGLAIKIIHKLVPPIDDYILQPIINDINMLMKSPDYLESTGDSERRLKCLEEELEFVQRYVNFDDTITLNTEVVEPFRKTPNQRFTNQPEPGCIIQ